MRTKARLVTRLLMLAAAVAALSGSSTAGTAGTAAQATALMAFRGRPELKVSEGGMARVPTMLGAEIGATLEVLITEVDGRYYWASRQNTEMGAVNSGAFTTFIALNGTGYVRVKAENIADTDFPVTPTEQRFDYVEHILLGLNSITYYGNRVDPTEAGR
jgi:hypothetical protein